MITHIWLLRFTSYLSISFVRVCASRQYTRNCNPLPHYLPARSFSSKRLRVLFLFLFPLSHMKALAAAAQQQQQQQIQMLLQMKAAAYATAVAASSTAPAVAPSNAAAAAAAPAVSVPVSTTSATTVANANSNGALSASEPSAGSDAANSQSPTMLAAMAAAQRNQAFQHEQLQKQINAAAMVSASVSYCDSFP